MLITLKRTAPAELGATLDTFAQSPHDGFRSDGEVAEPRSYAAEGPAYNGRARVRSLEAEVRDRQLVADH